MDRLALRRGLSRTPTRPWARRPPTRGLRSARPLPSVTQLSFWKSLVPKPFRASERRDARAPKPRPRAWNPATFFIVIYLFIGSMAIQQIALKREAEAFTRRADVRIGQLRDVVERLRRGEEVDVERALGVADPAQEQDWDDVLHDLEREGGARKPDRKQNESQAGAAASSSPSSGRATFF
ncbi:hypothetical protein P8C59_000381 [Phyllachora maydis]|uniref:Uncharacterized protein n=1 Tax=Phyllachora maydis TaxID=1825666 RepID=A0AAD9HW62_9PEZI|nr:hypothetical protein P8C59_000381 [Phyllachora maydis]